MRNISENIYRESQNTHFTSNNVFRKPCHLLDNLEKCGTARHVTDDNRAHALCMLDTTATDTHSEYVILVAFLQQKRIREHASLFRYTYIAFRVVKRTKLLSILQNLCFLVSVVQSSRTSYFPLLQRPDRLR